MTELFQELLVWVGQNPFWAGIIIFLVALAESLAVVGILVPGVVILFGAGALIGNGTLDFWSSCMWAVAGAVIGDNLSFWLGHYYEDRFAHLKWFSVHPNQLKKGEEFFEKHGGMSVAFGRFFGPIRAVIPLIAGLMRMKPSHFLIANVLSALVWAPAYLLPGMVFGASMELAGEVAMRLSAVILIIAAIYFGIFKLLHFVVKSASVRYALGVVPFLLAGLWLSHYLQRDINEELPSDYSAPAAVMKELQGFPSDDWKPAPNHELTRLIRFFSNSAPINELPVTYSAPGRKVWLKTLTPQRRLVVMIDESGASKLIQEQITDLWLLRIPVVIALHPEQ